MTQKKANSNGLYNKKVLAKFNAALTDAIRAVENGEDMRVRISNSNSKMGAVTSISTLPFITCPSCCAQTCGAKCYAAKLANLRPAVLRAYAINTALYLKRPEIYWASIDVAVKGVRFFRWHVSGDIANADYFAHVVEIARNNPHCEQLLFTKRFDTVNAWINENGAVPSNLHVLFSGWSNLTPDNPHNLPETNIIEKGAEPLKSWKICGGNCFNCACRGVGCWQAQNGETVAFPIH